MKYLDAARQELSKEGQQHILWNVNKGDNSENLSKNTDKIPITIK